MRQRIIGILLGIALTSAAAPALAGGSLNYATGVSPYGVATPVPAPIPVPVYEAAWYFRMDAAAGFGSDPSVSTIGTPFGGGSAAGTIGLNPVWLSKSFEPSFTGTLGVGYVWGAHWRSDLTVDIHSTMNADFNGSQTYANTAGPQALIVSDKTKFMSTILLMNLYYDFRTGTPFTPYIGGGLGFGVNQLTLSNNSTDSGVVAPFTTTTSLGDRTTQIEFAAAAMVGLNYEINSFTSVDVGYRYLYVGGTDVGIVVNGNNLGVDVGGINEHQVRVGLRFSVY